MQKNSKIITLLTILFNIIFVSICIADTIIPEAWYDPLPSVTYRYATTLGFYFFGVTCLLNLAIELSFGWYLYFKNYKKAIVTVAIVNIISQPLAMLSMGELEWFLSRWTDFSVILSILIIESAVIVFEMLVYRFALTGIPFWKAFDISLKLNIISLFIGFIIMLAFKILGIHEYIYHLVDFVNGDNNL